MPSLSDSSSARFLVPNTFLRVVWASSLVDECALDTLATDEMGHCMRKYTTPSTVTVTESLVRICKMKLWCCHHFDQKMWLIGFYPRQILCSEQIHFWFLRKIQNTYLLWGDVKGHSSQINLHKVISARQNKEKSWKYIKTKSLLLFVYILYPLQSVGVSAINLEHHKLAKVLFSFTNY